MDPHFNFHESETDQDANPTLTVILKIVFLCIILIVSMIFGLFPTFCRVCRNNAKLLGFFNSFGGGIFLGIGLIHLMPESSEKFEEYFSQESWKGNKIGEIPWSYVCAFLAYSLILFIEKVAFDSHSLIEHDHGHAHGHTHEEHNHDEELQESQPNAFESAGVDDNEQNESDEEEEAIRNVVSSKGKFASFLQVRNMRQSHVSGASRPANKALLRASQILTKTFSKSKYDIHEDMNLFVNPEKSDLIHVKDNKSSITKVDGKKEALVAPDHHHHHQETKSSKVLPFILLIALSFHGFFEGIALGLQPNLEKTLFLFIAIIAHKWAEAFTLGVSLFKAGTDNVMFVRLILLFSIFTPFGGIIGVLLSESSDLVEGIFLGLSTGTFLYIACSEVIIEEFALTKYKYTKFFIFLLGGLLVNGLSLIEIFGGGHGDDH